LAVSFNKINEEVINEITNEIYAQIDKLPTFPSSIERVVDLIHDKNSNINSIAKAVKMDPSLSMDILKLSNSAQFMLPKRVSTIEEAIKIVGLSGLELMLSGYGAKKILDKNLGEMESVWEHSFKCAFYAQEIAKNRRLDRKGVEDAYLGGLLHDLGRFVIVSIKKDMFEKISAVSAEKKLNIEILEELTLGITHAKVGAILAKKWNFPESLVEVIELHHEPLFASEQNAAVVYTVYFANMLCNIETGERKIDDIDEFILEFFNLSDKNLIHKIIGRLNELYKEKKKRFEK
jgi:putative nucleotidyltransferase with HDIG domain